MRVVLLSTAFPEYILDLANSLSKHNELLLIIPNNMSVGFRELISTKIKCSFFELPRQRNPRSILSMLEIVKSIKNFNPEIIHIQSSGYPWFFLVYMFLKKYSIIHTIHDPKPHLGEEKLRYKFSMFFCLRNTERFIVLSNTMKEAMIRYHKVDSKKIDVTYLGTPILHGMPKQKIPEVKNSVLFFGRIRKYKGLEYLIKSEPIISEEIPDLRIVIAGKGDDPYISMIEDKSKFQIINRFIEDSEINELFQKCSLVVLPYVEATQSHVMLWAYYFGKPVIVTNVGSFHEFVINGETGILIPPRDKKALARAIILLLKRPRLRKRMGQKCLDFMEDKFAWDQISDKTTNCYRKCLSE